MNAHDESGYETKHGRRYLVIMQHYSWDIEYKIIETSMTSMTIIIAIST